MIRVLYGLCPLLMGVGGGLLAVVSQRTQRRGELLFVCSVLSAPGNLISGESVPHESPTLANQNSRKLGVFDRKSLHILLLFLIKEHKAKMLKRAIYSTHCIN